ncbi:MAG: HPr family phosphocarrier protein [Planctomycetota bacterium]
MPEASLDKLVPEQDFARLLGLKARSLLRLACAPTDAPWTKRRFFELSYEADLVECFLDDYGGRRNRTFSLFTELVASARGFALAGLSLEHLSRRLPGYGVVDRLPGLERRAAMADIDVAHSFVRTRLEAFLSALLDEAHALGVSTLQVGEGSAPADEEVRRFRLPQNVGHDRLESDEQRIAEIASRYLAAATMLDELGLRSFADPSARERFMAEHCREEHARVFEATVHNLQSAYDTYVKNTVSESTDERLPRLRGHASATLHLLEAVTQLTHFVERHERGLLSDQANARVQSIVSRVEIREVTLERLLVWARVFMASGKDLAEGLVPSYSRVRSIEVQLADDVYLHARPASLIARVVGHHGTPVELTIGDRTCNAGSILELMVAIGSSPEARHVLLRGDERPLEDLVRLLDAGCGERGSESFPAELDYLRRRG